MHSFLLLFAKRNCHPVILFWEAFCYYEMRVHQEWVGQYFLTFCDKGKDKGVFNLLEVPNFVEDYCIDVLAKRAKPMRIR